MLNRSGLFKDLISEQFLFRDSLKYSIILTGTLRTRSYVLSDDIFLICAMFAKYIMGGETEDGRRYSREQASVRREVETLLGVPKSCFEVLMHEMRCWDVYDVVNISQVCVILHLSLIHI